MAKYIKPEIDIYDIVTDNDLLSESNIEDNAGVDEDQLSKGQHGAIFDIEDEDEDGFFYKEYTVNW